LTDGRERPLSDVLVWAAVDTIEAAIASC